MILIHGNAIKLLAKLTYLQSKYRRELLYESHIFCQLLHLLDLHQELGPHQGCCYTPDQYTEDARLFAKQLMEQKMFYGKLCSYSIHHLILELHDDNLRQNLNQTFISQGHASYDKNYKASNDNYHAHFFVTKVISPDHFYVILKEDLTSIRQTSLYLHTYSNSLKDQKLPPISTPYVGVPVQIHNSPSVWYRGRILKEHKQICQVLLIDYEY